MIKNLTFKKNIFFLLVLFSSYSCNQKLKNKKRTYKRIDTITNTLKSFGSIYGIDVSHHQGNIEWNKVDNWNNKKIDFVYVKATEGSSYIDPKYHLNIKGAKEKGILVGSYHYFRTTSSPEQQFLHFKNIVDKDLQDLIPMIDLEENKTLNSEEYNERVEKFLDLVKKYIGKKPILYSTQRFYNTHFKNRYISYYWNVARYNTKKQPNLLDNNKITVWQFSDKSQVYGIPKPVDLNIIYKDHNLDYLKL